jgi:hypothetical protein
VFYIISICHYFCLRALGKLYVYLAIKSYRPFVFGKLNEESLIFL